jgi:glycerol-3-phosphate acyltransferase PlsY
MTALIGIVASYLVGAFPFGLIITRIVKNVDVRQFGSGSTGFTNVYRVAGAVPAAVVALLDVAKGFLASVLIAPLFLSADGVMTIELYRIVCGCIAVLAHIFTVFAGFKGGKGVLTGLGVCIGIMPLEACAAFTLFALVFAATRFISAGSLVAAAALPIILLVEKYFLERDVHAEHLMFSVALALIVFLAHRKNIGRLLRGEENRFQRVKT